MCKITEIGELTEKWFIDNGYWKKTIDEGVYTFTEKWRILMDACYFDRGIISENKIIHTVLEPQELIDYINAEGLERKGSYALQKTLKKKRDNDD